MPPSPTSSNPAAPAQLPGRKIYARLLGYARPHLWIFGVAALCMMVSSMTDWMFAALIKPLTDQGFSGQPGHALWLYPLGVVAIFLVRGVFTFVSAFAMSHIGHRVLNDLRREMFERLVTLPTRYFDHTSSSHVINRLVYESLAVVAAVTTIVTNLIRSSFTLAGLIGWMFWINWRLSLFSLVLLPVIAVIVRAFSSRMRSLSRKALDMTGELTHVVQESIDCHKVVKVYGGEARERERFRHVNDALRGYARRITIASSGTVPFTQLAAALALAGVIWYALHLTQDNRLSAGEFVSFMTAMLMLLAPLKQLADISGPLERSLVAAEGVFTLMDETAEDDAGTRELARAQGAIELRDVSLTYPGSERPALSHVSLAIAPGETVALVGGSGGGKTSLANLIPRFYHASSGAVLIDGVPIEEVRLTSLRAQIALVSQDVVLFNDSIANNIAYGATNGTRDREAIRAAARAAHLLEFIDELPQGLDTLIGENGMRLSGGQRQRLAIARAILKDAPILILDEATSALDSESERHVQAALETLMQGRTTVVIAHRLSTIEKADHIVVLERGHLVESGTHAELLAANGAYANLYRIQYALEETPALADAPVATDPNVPPAPTAS